MSSRDDDKSTVPKFSSFKPREAPSRTADGATRTEEDSRELKAPRFSSFKPKGPVPSRIEQPARSKERPPEARRSNHRYDKPRKESSRHREYGRQEDPPKKRSRHDRGEATVVARTRPDNEGLPGVFNVDVKGDPLIRRYGESDRTHGIFYRRYGAGRVLGTTGRLVIHRDGPRDQFTLRMPGEGPLLSRDHGGLRSRFLRSNAQPIFLRSKGGQSIEDASDEYLAVDESRKRKRDEDTDSSEDERPSYRSIEGQAKPKYISDDEEDDTDALPTDEVSMEQSSPLKWKSIQLNRLVKEHPDNIDAWLELVGHQDVLLQAGQGIDGITPENEARSYAEIKLSMLESALSYASTTEDKRRVLVHLMKEGVKVWNTKTAAKKWAELESDEQESFELWKIHLEFAATSIATFQYDDIKRMLLDRLRLVLARAATNPTKESFEEAIYVFLMATCLLFDAGYMELAVAAWQGLLDLNFFRPDKVPSNNWALQTFGEFWENEFPRLGEAEARGWGHYVETAGAGEPPEPLEKKTSDDASSRDAHKAWGIVERGRAANARMPARTMDEGTDDDPFRVVIFSDIEPMLFLVPEDIISAVAEQLIDASLLFSGYPPAFKSSKWSEMAFYDQFVWRNRDELDYNSLQNLQNHDAENTEARTPPFAGRGMSLAGPPDLHFANTAWFQASRNYGNNHGLSLETVSTLTRQLVLGAKVEKLGYYHLTLSFCLDPASMKKSAKALLKQYPTNAELYNAYALAEAAGEHHDVASKVLSSVTELTMTSGDVGSALLWSTWSLMEFENGRIDMALRRLCAVVDETLRQKQEAYELSPMHVLKTFSARMDEKLASGDVNGAGVYTNSLTLLAYLQGEGSEEPRSTMQGDVSAAMSVLHAMTQRFRARGFENSVVHERALQFGARLLYLHACKGPFRRVYMREQLSLFLDIFPRNTIFISLFEWADSSIRVVDETRQVLAEKVLKPNHDNVVSRITAIKHELTRGNVHSTKAAFERAVSSDSCKFNPRLWVAYLRFCRSQESLRRGAKDIFYRALRHCPWSKEVMMEAFATLAGDLSSEELKAVYNTMTSKGLRIHVDLGEFVDKRRARRDREDGRKKR